MLEIVGLRKEFARKREVVSAIDDVNLSVGEGELLVLLGPSGSGKTTVLRCIAGHETADSGLISVGNRTVFDAAGGVLVPPDKRRIGMVFQSYALWPHMTVRRNIEFPLRAQRMKGSIDFATAVADVAKLVDCQHLLDRYPGELSGGQQQRVALARGIVARPAFMLFDEPLSNLDALLRAQVRQDLHRLHQTLGFGGVYVTHDQSEAFAIGDRVAIMHAGRIEQLGTPGDIYSAPATEFAANFVGLSNRLTFTPAAEGWQLSGTGSAAAPLPLDPAVGEVSLRFRPSAAQLATASDASGLVLHAAVEDTTYEGAHYAVAVDVHGTRVVATLPATVANGRRPAAGDRVTIAVPWEECRWYCDGIRTEPREVRLPAVSI